MPVEELHVSLEVLGDPDECYDGMELWYSLKFLVANSSLRVMVAVGCDRRQWDWVLLIIR